MPGAEQVLDYLALHWAQQAALNPPRSVRAQHAAGLLGVMGAHSAGPRAEPVRALDAVGSLGAGLGMSGSGLAWAGYVDWERFGRAEGGDELIQAGGLGWVQSLWGR